MNKETIEEIDEKAAFWAARVLSGTLTHEEKAALDDWLTGGEDRRRAYRTYMEIAELTAGAGEGPAESLLESDLVQFAARSEKLATGAERGTVRYEGARLADIAAEINRRFGGELVLGDPALADLKVTGELGASDRARAVRDLCDILALTVETRDGDTIVLLPKK